jgi:hypothetical protein
MPIRHARSFGPTFNLSTKNGNFGALRLHANRIGPDPMNMIQYANVTDHGRCRLQSELLLEICNSNLLVFRIQQDLA